MRVGTIASLAASAVLGLGALAVARIWLPSQSAKPTAQQAPAQAPGVPVVLAKGPIAYGAKLQPTDLVLARLPSDAAPPGAFSSVDQVLKSDSGGAPVALTAFSAREPILPARLSGPGAKPTLAAVVGQGMRAYTIAVTDVAGGGGHILPGDRVDVLLTLDLVAVQQNGNAGVPGNAHRWVSDIVLQNVKVLGMDLNVDTSSTKPAVAHTATLEVSPADSAKLALAAQAGALSLALRRAGSAEIDRVGVMAIHNLGPVAAPGADAQVQRVRAHVSGAPAPSGEAVLVVQGENSAKVSVPVEHFRAGV